MESNHCSFGRLKRGQISSVASQSETSEYEWLRRELMGEGRMDPDGDCESGWLWWWFDIYSTESEPFV